MLRRALLFAMLVLPAWAGAQEWPTKPIRFVVPFAPGGSSDVVSRSVAQELTKQLGQSVFVENKPGGAGTIAMSDVANSPPDGYTIILGHVGVLAVNPYAMKKHPYDVNKSFIPVALLARVPNILAVHPDVPAKTFKEFVDYAKKNPGKLNYGSAGNGSAGHLSMEYLKSVTGAFVVHIPYRGTGPQMQDMLAGRTEVAMVGAPGILPHVRSGKLRALAVGSTERMKNLPDVPTVAESGYPGFETSQWYGVLLPANTPKPIVDKLSAEIGKALKSSSVTQRFAADDAVAGSGTPENFATFIRAEQKRWEAVVQRANIVIE
jgi:tripartite-type tricarboxylate transporter receptor subunit TctC